jgi:predicted nucleotidyltransferase
METTGHVPEELLRAVVDYFDPQRVILFGSRARGDAGEDSDIDLLVVVDDDTPAEKLSWEAVWRVRDGHAGPLDLMACRSSTLERRARAIGSFAHTLMREGKVVYERR